MYMIPIVTTDKILIENTSSALDKFIGDAIELISFGDVEKTVEYLSIEMPELLIVNFSDHEIDTFDLLDKIMGDSWLLHGGIIGICRTSKEIERIEMIKGANLIIAIDYEDFKDYIFKVLSIIFNNRRILFQREISSDFIQNISGSFKLKNDTYEVKCYVNLICNFLFNSNRLKLEQKFNLKLALTEMLFNAIEHGNCEISYEEKSEWLEKSLEIDSLISEKSRQKEISERKVTFEYSISPQKGIFSIIDEGKGFDWRNVKDVTKDENILELHGRGILITRALVSNLKYNEKGNEVSFEVIFEKELAGLTPGLFQSIPARDIVEGEIIFKQGEPSDYLYYIVKGVYSVIVNEKVVSTLTPDDIFMGEMSFLLNNQRSATIKAQTSGRLIEISKKDFVEAIREKPHYALFLCRLLAQRIDRSNLRKTESDIDNTIE